MNDLSKTSKIDFNRALGRRFFQAQDQLRGGPAPELCAPGYRAVIGGNPALDRAGHEQFAVAFYGGFPNINHYVEQVIADDDWVVVRAHLRGTHSANFFGIPATNRAVAIAMHVLLKIADGKVTELYGLFDEAGLRRQLGVLQS